MIVHTILGLPGESRSDILDTMRYLNEKNIQGIKLQLLHVLKGTIWNMIILQGSSLYMKETQYPGNLVIDCLENLDPEIVIHRITGGWTKGTAFGAFVGRKEKRSPNMLHHRMKERDTWQGKQLGTSL